MEALQAFKSFCLPFVTVVTVYALPITQTYPPQTTTVKDAVAATQDGGQFPGLTVTFTSDLSQSLVNICLHKCVQMFSMKKQAFQTG